MTLQRWQETFVTSQADGTALTTTTPASMIPSGAKYTLPANYFDTLGKQLLVKAWGRITSVVTTPGTAQFLVKFGATTVFDGLAVLLDSVQAHTNVGWALEILLTCRVIGSVASLFGQGTWTCEDILGVTTGAAPRCAVCALIPWASAPAVGATFDSAVSQQVDVFFGQTVATGSLTSHQFQLISPN